MTTSTTNGCCAKKVKQFYKPIKNLEIMRTGRILDNVGFRKTDGVIRKLTIRERLLQIQMSKRSGELNHPIHGKIVVDISKVADLLRVDNHELIRYKRAMFEI